MRAFITRHSLALTALAIALSVFLVACAVQSAQMTVGPTATPVPSPVPRHTPTATSTPRPASTTTPTPTSAPTLAPGAVGTLAASSQSRLDAAGVEPLCLRLQDTDSDGRGEWLGLYLQPADPPELMAFVLDGPRWHELNALEKEKHGLGGYPTCELDVRDVNVDGRPEILVWGHAEDSIDLLHIFVWDGTTYATLASFQGDAGVRLENADGDLADEVVVGYEAENDLAWEAIHTWDGANYVWTWERYRWFYLDRPHSYPTDTPEHAVISFYLAVDDRDLPGAYHLLTPGTRAAQPYEAWVVGFARTVAVEVGAVEETERSDDTAIVTAQVRAYDNRDGRVVATLWDVEWTTVLVEDGWRLRGATTKQLDSWEAPYYRR